MGAAERAEAHEGALASASTSGRSCDVLEAEEQGGGWHRVKFVLDTDEEAKLLRAQVAVTHFSRGRFEIGIALLRNCGERLAAQTLLSIIEKGVPGTWKDSESVPSPAHLKWLCLREYRALVEVKGSEGDSRLSENLEFPLLLQYAGQPNLTEPASYSAKVEATNASALSASEVADLKELFEFEWKSLNRSEAHRTSSTLASRPRALKNDKKVCIEKFFLFQPTLLSLLVQLFTKVEKRQSSLEKDENFGISFLCYLADIELDFLQQVLYGGNLELVEMLLPHLLIHHDVNFKKYDAFVTSLLSNSSSSSKTINSICASGNLGLIRLAESAEDKKLLSLHPDGLMAYLEQQIEQGTEISPNDTTLLKLTRLHNENLYLCLIQLAINTIDGKGDAVKAKSVLMNFPELHSVFLVLLWDRVINQEDCNLSLQDLSQIFHDFEPRGKEMNTMSKILKILKHRLLLSSHLIPKLDEEEACNPFSVLREMNSKSIAQILSDAAVYDKQKALEVVENWPAYSTKEKVTHSHDLNVFHVRGSIFTFLKAFSLTNISFADTEAQEEELRLLLDTMRDHVKKTTCSFSLSWIAWFCYVFFNCRYHENMSNWKSVGSDFFKAEMKDHKLSCNKQESQNSKYPVKFFDSLISIIEDCISRAISVDLDFVSFHLSSSDRGSDIPLISDVLVEIVRGRLSALESFVDQARWRLNIIKRMFNSETTGSFASWPEIFKILHATPMRLLQICKSYNQYALCDETVKKYSILESEASSVHLAEWIDGLTTRVSVDGMITQMSINASQESGIEATNKSAVDEFNTFVQGCQMGELEKLLLYLDVGTAAALSANVSEEMLDKAKSIIDEFIKSDEATQDENKLVLQLCENVISALSDLSKEDIRSVSEYICSANVKERGQDLGKQAKAVQMLVEALQFSKDGKKQFLSGVLHNICRALLADSCIKSESFKSRLTSVGILNQLLQDASLEDENTQPAEYLSTFISYLAHIGDAIASVDGQDTYNHFNLLSRDPRDILLYILFERKSPETAARIANLLHTNLIDEVLKVCVPQIYPPLSQHGSSEGQDAISKHDWDRNILVLKSLVEKSPLRIALACLFISYRESEQQSDILSFALEQLSAYPTLHRWIKIQFFIQQMKSKITNESSGPKSTILETNFEQSHSEGILQGCLWEDLEVYRSAINRIVSNGKLHEAMLLSDRCFQEGSSDSLLTEIINSQAEGDRWPDVALLALRLNGEEELWSHFLKLWDNSKNTMLSLQALIDVASKCKSTADSDGKIYKSLSERHRKLELYKQVILIDNTYEGERWKDIDQACTSSPKLLLKRLSLLGAHQLISEIASEFGVNTSTLRELEGEALLSSLSDKSVDGGGTSGVIRRLSAMEPNHGLIVAFFALRSSQDMSSKKVFLSYILSEEHKERLGTALEQENVLYVSRVKMGIDILSKLPNTLAFKYKDLLEMPELILENLIISLEIPFAKTICLLYPDLISNKRIIFYAYKACCFEQSGENSDSAGETRSEGRAGTNDGIFPLLEGLPTDEMVRKSYHYKIAPSIPLCESILSLSTSSEAAAVNASLVAMKLSIVFLNGDSDKRGTKMTQILNDLERTETILEIIEKAQECFEATFSEKMLEFEGWDSIWDASMAGDDAYNFDLYDIYEKLLAALAFDKGSAMLRNCVVYVANFAVRLDLIHTLLSHDIPVSFKDFATLSSINGTLRFISEEEYYNIAIFVSNKFALNPSKIWETWGLGLINLSEYIEARAKVERAIKAALSFSEESRQAEIAMHAVETLEKGRMVKVSKIYDTTHKLLQEKNVKHKGWFGFRDTGKTSSDAIFRNLSSSQIDSEVYNECLYYLKRFVPENLLQFYFKHKQYQQACLFAIENKSTKSIEHLSKACIHFEREDILISFFREELSRDSDNREVIVDLWKHAIEIVCIEKRFALAYRLQILEVSGTFAAILALRSFKECDSRQDADLWLGNSMDQILQVSGREHDNFETLGIQCRDLGISNLLEMRGIVGLQIDVMKFAEKDGSDFKSWDIVGDNDMIAFHRRRAAELILLKDGNLAFRLIQEFRLQATEVYIDSIRQYCKNKKHIGSLIPLVKDLKGTLGDLDWDHVIGSAFFVLLNECNDRARAKQIMKLLVSDHSKILAYLALGKLEKAFDLAVACADEVDIELIAKHAKSKGKQQLLRKCEEWLRNKP